MSSWVITKTAAGASASFCARYDEDVAVRQRVWPPEVAQATTDLFVGLEGAAECLCHARFRDFQLQLPLFESFGVDFAGDQVIGLNLDLNVLQPGIPREPEQLSADQRIETGLAKTREDALNAALHQRIFRIVPDQLPIQVVH